MSVMFRLTIQHQQLTSCIIHQGGAAVNVLSVNGLYLNFNGSEKLSAGRNEPVKTAHLNNSVLGTCLKSQDAAPSDEKIFFNIQRSVLSAPLAVVRSLPPPRADAGDK